MAGLLPLLPTPPASLKLRDTAVESRAPKRHRPLEPPVSDSRRPQPDSPPSSRRRTGELPLPPPPNSNVRRRSRSPPPFSVRRRSRSPPPYKVQRRLRSPPPSKVRCRSRSPSIEAPSRSARRKKMKRQIRAEVIKEMREAPSRDDHRKNMKRQIWAEAKEEFREMKKDKLLENIKKLQACVWLLEKDGADMAKIMEFRSLLESAKKQYVENEAQLAKEGSSAPLKVLNKDRLEKTHVETIAAPVEKVDRDEQSMDSGKGEVRSLNCEEVSDENELAEEVNHLKSELETVRQDRDYQLAQAQSLMADIAKQKEVTRRYELELEDAMMRVAALEKGCLLRRETIKALQIQLASANEKLTVPSPTREKLMPN